jgi:hypothetical protein
MSLISAQTTSADELNEHPLHNAGKVAVDPGKPAPKLEDLRNNTKATHMTL